MTAFYSDVRSTLRTGDMVCWRKTRINNKVDFLLYLYQLIFQADFVHTGIVVKLGNRYFVMEATPPKLRLYPLSMCKDFFLVRVNTNARESMMVDSLLSHIGKDYNLMDFVRTLFRLSETPDDYNCSELCAVFYNEFGIINDHRAGLTPDSITRAVCNAVNTKPEYIKMDVGRTVGK